MPTNVVRRTALTLTLVAGVANAAPEPPPPPAAGAPSLGGNCGSLPASFQKDVAAAEKARDASFDKALAAKKLTRWTGGANVHVDDAGRRPPRKVATSGDVAVIDAGSGEPSSPPVVELAADKAGTVYRVVRMPRGDHMTYTQCGCAPITRGGAAIRIVHYVAELPKGVKYGGTVEIAYTDKVPVATWTNNRSGQPCPMPP